jgi:molybdate transport system substrate-binding protein
MATRQLLAELTDAWQRQSGVEAVVESVGGVDAARRVQAGEPFDVVVLASDAIGRLVETGSVLADSVTDLVRSPVAIAVPAGSGRARPDVSTEATLREAVLSATSIGYSTGPSGTALLRLVERWGITDLVRSRLVQASPGIPVGALVADGRAAIGFQQLSELMHLPGVTVVGGMPPGCEIVTTFTGGVCTASVQPVEARRLLAFMASPAAADAKRRHGMEPA